MPGSATNSPATAVSRRVVGDGHLAAGSSRDRHALGRLRSPDRDDGIGSDRLVELRLEKIGRKSEVKSKIGDAARLVAYPC